MALVIQKCWRANRSRLYLSGPRIAARKKHIQNNIEQLRQEQENRRLQQCIPERGMSSYGIIGSGQDSNVVNNLASNGNRNGPNVNNVIGQMNNNSRPLEQNTFRNDKGSNPNIYGGNPSGFTQSSGSEPVNNSMQNRAMNSINKLNNCNDTNPSQNPSIFSNNSNFQINQGICGNQFRNEQRSEFQNNQGDTLRFPNNNNPLNSNNFRAPSNMNQPLENQLSDPINQILRSPDSLRR